MRIRNSNNTTERKTKKKKQKIQIYDFQKNK